MVCASSLYGMCIIVVWYVRHRCMVCASLYGMCIIVRYLMVVMLAGDLSKRWNSCDKDGQLSVCSTVLRGQM